MLCENCKRQNFLTDDEIDDIIVKYLATFDLTKRDLSSKRAIRPVGNMNGVSLSEIRRCLCLLLKERTKKLLKEIAIFAGITDHSSVSTAIKSARNFRDRGDERFNFYYTRLLDCVKDCVE